MSDHEAEELPALASRLRAARVRRGWSRETLAHHAGLSWAAVAQIEAGRRTNVRPATLTALAAALGVTVGYLLGLDTEQKLLEHGALLYGSPEEFVGGAAPFLRDAMRRSEDLLVVTTRTNRHLLAEELGPDADRVRFGDSSTWYGSPLEVLSTYRAFVHERLGAGVPWITVVGEPLWDGGEDGIRPWVTYEALFNLLFASSPLTVICPYDTRSVHPSVVESARWTHPSLVSASGPAPNPAYRDPSEYLFDDRR